MEIRKISVSEMSLMTKEEIEQIPSNQFDIYGTETYPGYVLDALKWDTWDKFTYDQLNHIRYSVFLYISENIIQLLIDKFKDKQELVNIEKNINGKIIPIQSYSLCYRLEKAKKEKKDILNKINEAKRVYQKYCQYHVDDIPESCIKQMLMLDKIDNKIIEILKSYEKMPFFIQIKYVLQEMDINKCRRMTDSYLRAHGFQSLRIGNKDYYIYDDIIRAIAIQPR